MLTGTSNRENQEPNNPAYDGHFSIVRMGEEATTGPESGAAPRNWERREVQEMRQARRMILRAAWHWARLVAGPFALVGLGLGSILGPAARWLHPGWAAPSFLVNLTLGALGGALGAALVGALAQWLFEEAKDVPIVGGCAATLFVVTGGIYGAGLGGVWSTLVGLAVGAPVGLVGGVAVYFVYWSLKEVLRMVQGEVKGY